MKLLTASALLIAFASSAAAQGGSVTLYTGLAYNPDPIRTVAVLPVKGQPYADSLLEIVHRDLHYSDRLTMIRLNAADNALFYDRFKGVSYDYFTGINTSYVVEMTAAQNRVSIRIHDVSKRRVSATADFPLPANGLSRDWRLAVHSASDSAVAILTEGPRGMAATRIAYTRGGGSAGTTIRMVDYDGANDVQIPADSNALTPAWDPSGNRLAYISYGNVPRVMMTDIATGRPHVVQPRIRNVSPTTPIFAPDGQSILYTRYDGDSNVSTMWRVPLNGGDPVLIDKGRGISSSPSFSPDGRRIAFMTDRIGHNEVYIMDADGSNKIWITQIAGDVSDLSYRAEPDWSPDGVTIAMQSRVRGERFQIILVNLRDNSARLITSDGENQSPSWAPDGRHIVYTSNRSGSDQLWIMDVRSGVTRQLTNQSGARYGAWSPRLTLR